MIFFFNAGPCNFESGLCGWQDVSLGVYQWSRNQGSTVVAGTGPSVDHTCGNNTCKFAQVATIHVSLLKWSLHV